MTLIIGIDPGSQRTGYGLIQQQGGNTLHVASGYLNLTLYPAAERLRRIFMGIQEIIQSYQPQEAAVEQVFMSANPNSALKLGQARGAALVALTIPFSEYAARQVKKAVVGNGAASKEQVQYMIRHLLNLQASQTLQPDAADALAVAICHAHTRKLQQLGLQY